MNILKNFFEKILKIKNSIIKEDDDILGNFIVDTFSNINKLTPKHIFEYAPKIEFRYDKMKINNKEFDEHTTFSEADTNSIHRIILIANLIKRIKSINTRISRLKQYDNDLPEEFNLSKLNKLVDYVKNHPEFKGYNNIEENFKSCTALEKLFGKFVDCNNYTQDIITNEILKKFNQISVDEGLKKEFTISVETIASNFLFENK